MKTTHPHPAPRLLLSAAACLSLLALLASVPLAAAQNLPAASPTVTPPPPLITAPTSSPAQNSATHARVQVRDGIATVTANNSSLNQILRELADRSHMTISGGVADERVFGSYGPADVSTILTMLLEGTGSNMLLLETADDRPRELVITPRGGGPSPPSPPALGSRDRDTDREDDNTSPQQVRNFDNRLRPKPPAPTVQAAPPPAPIIAAPVVVTTPPAAVTTQQSPNGVKTPQQIYEDLIKLQQTQPQQTHPQQTQPQQTQPQQTQPNQR